MKWNVNLLNIIVFFLRLKKKNIRRIKKVNWKWKEWILLVLIKEKLRKIEKIWK